MGSLSVKSHRPSIGDTGFVYVLKALRDLGDIEAVYDLTIAYHPIVPQTELSFFTGFPKGDFLWWEALLKLTVQLFAHWRISLEFHVNVRRFDLKDIPREDEELAKWLRQRWIAKEKLLEEFSKTKSLGDEYLWSLFRVTYLEF
jgi:hypothetical protein